VKRNAYRLAASIVFILGAGLALHRLHGKADGAVQPDEPIRKATVAASYRTVAGEYPALHAARAPGIADPSTVAVHLTPEAQAMASLRERLLAEAVELRRIQLPEGLDDEVVIPLGGPDAERLVLKKHSVRSANFRVVTQNEDGTFNELPAGPVRTYMGGIEGDPDATVGASLLSSGLSARIVAGCGPDRAIAPLTAEEAGVLGGDVPGTGILHALYTPREIPAELLGCPEEHVHGEACVSGLSEPSRFTEEGVEIAALNEDGTMAPSPEAVEPPQVEASIVPDVTVKQAELGIDVGYTFFANRCGSNTTTAQQTVEDWVNDVLNLVFIRDAIIEHTVGTIVIRTTSATCPYYSLTSGYDTLPKLREIWNGQNATYPQPSTTHDIAHCAVSQPQGVTGLAYVGVVGTANRYSMATANSGMGYWTSGARHEVGHNWSLGHGDGAGELTPWGAGIGLMTGSYHDRANSVESTKMIQHRNSRSPGVLDDIGPYTAANIAPYCKQDVGLSANVGGAAKSFDVLANDHDANNSAFTIEWIMVDMSGVNVMQTPPVAAATPLGGSLIRSIGTGPNGRDQILYTPPASGSTGGTETFHYGVRDATGKGNWGYCTIVLGDPPSGPFGEISTSCVLADSLWDWSEDEQPRYGWEFGHYSAGTTFTPNLATNSFYSNWIGGDGRLWTRSGGTPEVGQYAQNTHATYPSVRRWTSSYAGRVAIEYDARRLRYEGDGVDVEIRHNGALLMTHTLNHNVSTNVVDPDTVVHAGTLYADLAEGDAIDFVLRSTGDATYDWTQFHGRILEGGCAREDDGLLMRFPLDTGNEMAKGGSGVYFDARNWGADMGGGNHHVHFTGHDPLFDWAPGVVGNAFAADGSTSFGKTIESDIGEGATELTISVWVKPEAKTDNDGIITCTGTDFCGLIVSAYGSGNPGEFRCRSNRVTGPDNSVPVGRWSHMVGVWKSGAYQILYIDGKEVARAATPPSGAIADIGQWFIGRDREINGRFMKALIDEATLWTRALSPTEVQALYEETKPARYCHGVADIYTIDNPLVSSNFTEFTIGTWLRPHSKSGGVQGIVTTAVNTNTQSYFGLNITAYGEGNPVEFRAASKYIFGPANSAPIGEWIHAVGVWKAGVMQKLYIDGALAGEVPQAEVVATPANVGSWVVGRDRDTWSNRYFDGDIGEPLIVERAFTDDEVLELYQRERTRFNSGQTRIPGSLPVGAPAIAGELFEASGVYTLTASGAGIGGTSDSMQLAGLNRSAGMADVQIKLESLSAATTNSMAGIMLRDATAANAPFVMLARRADGMVGVMQRTASGAVAAMPVAWQSVGTGSGLWLRLLRSGDGVAARYSLDGASWSDLGVVLADLSPDALAGVAVSAATQLRTSTAAVSDPYAEALPAGEGDIDGDGLADSWEMGQFGSLGVSSGGPGEDWDRDGASDLDEFRAGTDPKDPSSFLGFATAPELLAGGDIRLSWSAVAGKTYRIIATDDLVAGTWTEVLAGIPATVPVTTRDVVPPLSAPTQFYRVEVENPSTP